MVREGMERYSKAVWGEEMNFARKLQIGMAVADVTPKELAAEVKSSTSSVYEWLGGKRRPHERKRAAVLAYLERRQPGTMRALEYWEREGIG